MTELQSKILEIAVYFDKFCSDHGIKYFLMGGSALGAMRHGGFIPWDDDFDVFMDRINYLKLIECFKTDLDTETYYFQRGNTKELPFYFSKLRMNGTTLIESEHNLHKDFHQGVFIDIMCLNNAARGKMGRKMQYYCAGLLKANALTKTGYRAKSVKKKLQLFISKIFVWGPFKKLLLHNVLKYNKKESDTLAHLFGRAKFDKSFYPLTDFTEQRRVKFEDTKLPVPSGVEEYLAIRYGADYMQMPSEETKAQYQSHVYLCDVNNDYRKYLRLKK